VADRLHLRRARKLARTELAGVVGWLELIGVERHLALEWKP
jgi:hypothetical protein